MLGRTRWNLSKSSASMCRPAAVLLLAFLAMPATALQVFEDKASFLASTAATSATGPLPTVPGFATILVAGSVTITPMPGATMVIGQSSPSHYGTALLPGKEITLVGLENINYALAAPVYSLGFDFAEPNVLSGCGVACVDTTFAVTLRSAGTAVGEFSFNAPNAVAAFVGVWSEVHFDRVEIRETLGSADSEFFGEVFTGSVSAVPEVPTALTLAVALPLLGGWLRRQRSRRGGP